MKVAFLTLITLVVFIIVVILRLSRYQGTDLGNSITGFKTPENAKIDAKAAIHLASPFLDESYSYRKKMRGEVRHNSWRTPNIWLSVKKNWYYITKDDYPSYTPGYYMRHAVRVHIYSGEVIPPEPYTSKIK